MLQCAKTRPAERIAAIVGEILGKHGFKGPVPIDGDLASLGLTSIDMVELMLAIEAEFDLTIPSSEINLPNFGSIAAIETMVQRLDARR